MAVRGKNKHYRLSEILRRHFNETAALIGIGENAEPLIGEILKRTPDVVTSVQREVPDGFPPNVLDRILSGLTDSSRRLAAMPA